MFYINILSVYQKICSCRQFSKKYV